MAGWILLEWVAWTLIFSAGTPGVVESQSGEAADFWARAYFAGYALFTLGLGDYRPVGPVSQMLTDLAAANGFLTLSLSATYFVPVVSAAVGKRQLATYIRALGKTPDEILISCWNGRDFSDFGEHLKTLAPSIIQIGQQHLAYPVLHHYGSDSPDDSLPVRITALDEALAVLEHGVIPETRLSRAVVAPASEGIGSFLASLNRLHLNPAREAPPVPSLERLRQAGIPLVKDAEFLEAINARNNRRRLALSLVRDAGWQWVDVVSSKGD